MRHEVLWLLAIVGAALILGVLLDLAFWALLRSVIPVPFAPTQLPTL